MADTSFLANLGITAPEYQPGASGDWQNPLSQLVQYATQVSGIQPGADVSIPNGTAAPVLPVEQQQTALPDGTQIPAQGQEGTSPPPSMLAQYAQQQQQQDLLPHPADLAQTAPGMTPTPASTTPDGKPQPASGPSMSGEYNAPLGEDDSPSFLEKLFALGTGGLTGLNSLNQRSALRALGKKIQAGESPDIGQILASGIAPEQAIQVASLVSGNKNTPKPVEGMPGFIWDRDSNGSWVAKPAPLAQSANGAPGSVFAIKAIPGDLQGNDYLSAAQQLSPSAANQIKGIVEGRLQLPPATTRNPEQLAIRDGALQAFPNVAQYDYPAIQKTRESATSGTLSKSNNAINTALGHVATLAEKASALDNSSLPVWNTVANAADNATGGKALIGFNQAVASLAPEIVSAYRAGGGSEADIQAQLKTLGNSSASPDQQKEALTTIAELLKSKIDANYDQYSKGMGPAAKQDSFYTPKTIATLQKFGVPLDPNQKAPDTPVSAAPAEKPATDTAAARKAWLAARPKH